MEGKQWNLTVPVIKQRMQAQGATHKTIAQCARAVYRAEGLHAFYVSYPTTLCMTVPFTATQFVAYESISKVMNPNKEYDPLTHCVAGGLAGAVAAAVKTLLQTRGITQDPEARTARGLFDAATIIQRKFGWTGFLRGIRPRIISTMPSTAICWYVAGSPIVWIISLTRRVGHRMRWQRHTSSISRRRHDASVQYISRIVLHASSEGVLITFGPI